jgi:GPH family glycoside/pentoside/hexuronide:cation symporter/probable glucitol transport protein GutA
MTVEYSELKTGQRNEGLISSTQTFTSKLSIAIASGVTALSLIIGKYVVGEVTPLVTSTFMITVSLIPAILLAIGAIPVLFFELTTKRHKEIVEELEERKKVISELSE